MVSSKSRSLYKKILLLFAFSFSLLSHQTVFATPQEDGWEEIFPGGETLCARGEPFAFFVNRGTSPNVMVDFIGGGACWDANTCSEEGATFVDSVDMIRNMYKQGLKGVYDRKNTQNPMRDWTHIVIPYCTGDIHWGENDKVYTKADGESFTIHHRGATNAKAVFEWVKREVLAPKKLLMTGCSAGSYGSIYWTPHYRKHYPNAVISQMGDSGAGIITQKFLQQSFDNWQAERNAPQWVPGLNPNKIDWHKMTLNDYYKAVGSFYPGVQLGQFSYLEDENQIFFHEIMGGEPEEWSPIMQKSLLDLSTSLSNFKYYLAEGEEHCVLPYDRFYSENSGAAGSFKDWYKNHANQKGVIPFPRPDEQK